MATQIQIAEHSGLCRQTIANHQKTGVLSKGDDLLEALGKLVKHYSSVETERDPDLTLERIRLTREQADKLERERLRDEGESFTRDEIQGVYGNILKNLTTRILAIPPKIGPLLIGLKRPAQGKDIVESFLHEALREVSEPTPIECKKEASK